MHRDIDWLENHPVSDDNFTTDRDEAIAEIEDDFTVLVWVERNLDHLWT